MTPELWVCILCPTGVEWAFTYDPSSELGECPFCHYSAGVFPVSAGETAFDESLRTTALAAIQAGRVDHLDPMETTP